MQIRTVTILSVAGVATAACVAAGINVQVLSAATEQGRPSSQSLQDAGALGDPAIRVVAPASAPAPAATAAPESIDESVTNFDEQDGVVAAAEPEPVLPPAPSTQRASAGAAGSEPETVSSGASTPTPTADPTPTDEPDPTPTDEPSPVGSEDPEPSESPSESPAPEESPTAQPSDSASPSASE